MGPTIEESGWEGYPVTRDRVNDLGIIYSGWLDPAVTDVDDLDQKALFVVHREAIAKAIKKAMRNEPTIDRLLENQDKIQHDFHELGLKRKL
jgi:5,6,7,8-tetrahydromethanopterin hydro-lyase